MRLCQVAWGVGTPRQRGVNVGGCGRPGDLRAATWFLLFTCIQRVNVAADWSAVLPASRTRTRLTSDDQLQLSKRLKIRPVRAVRSSRWSCGRRCIVIGRAGFRRAPARRRSGHAARRRRPRPHGKAEPVRPGALGAVSAAPGASAGRAVPSALRRRPRVWRVESATVAVPACGRRSEQVKPVPRRPSGESSSAYCGSAAGFCREAGVAARLANGTGRQDRRRHAVPDALFR